MAVSSPTALLTRQQLESYRTKNKLKVGTLGAKIYEATQDLWPSKAAALQAVWALAKKGKASVQSEERILTALDRLNGMHMETAPKDVVDKLAPIPEVGGGEADTKVEINWNETIHADLNALGKEYVEALENLQNAYLKRLNELLDVSNSRVQLISQMIDEV